MDKPKVTGIGGVFFKAKDHVKLIEWYKNNLGIDYTEYGANFVWDNSKNKNGEMGNTAFSIFKQDSKYYPGNFMINFRVNNLKGLIENLKLQNVQMEEKIENYDYGSFAWIYDPEGNKIELWEAADIKLD